MNRIRNLFKKDKDKLIVFLTAGYPEINSTEKLVLTAVESGADMTEIGIPFSAALIIFEIKFNLSRFSIPFLKAPTPGIII